MNKGYLAALIVLALLTVLSLALNAIAISALLRFDRIGRETLASARQLLAGIEDETFTYTFRIEDEFPFQTTVPINDKFTVPLKTTIPINTTVAVPINLGFTTYNLKVPINTVFPLDMEFTVPVSMTMEVDVTVPIDMEVPVEIAVSDTPFVRYLSDVKTTLDELEQEMGDPLGLGVDLQKLTEER
jgi:hypothetical protein